jgi:hypothetical protein
MGLSCVGKTGQPSREVPLSEKESSLREVVADVVLTSLASQQAKPKRPPGASIRIAILPLCPRVLAYPQGR